MSRIGIVLALLLFGAGGAAAQALPPPMSTQQNEWFAECRSFGGRPVAGPEFVTREDLNGDGQPDYILSVNGMNCEGAFTALCAGQACPLAVFLSGQGGYRRAYLENVHAWEIDRSVSPPAMKMMWLASHCGINYRGPDVCERRYAASGQTMSQVGGLGAAREATPRQQQQPQRQQQQQAAAPGAGAAAAWQLRPVQGRGDAAMATGPGVIAGLALVCNGPVPIAVFTLRARPPQGQTVVSFAFSSGRIDAPIRPLQGAAANAWYADLRASRLPRMLAGNDASVPILINGGRQGTLSLSGSTAAIRSALAACYPF
ncbi:hypothetical protein [Elioraea rosea]|uniref:hypothetical protein n=1 Tax=Elioraea rosea TaxID=2492390 RepID=UPI001184DF06|nr:hypothetical protein [Elioraea rosea]